MKLIAADKLCNLFIYFFSPLLLFGCYSNYEVSTPEIVFKNISDQNTSDTTVTKRLDSFLSFEWDTMFILQPYQQPLLKECGYDFDLPDSKIENTEGGEEYLFIKNKKIIKHLIHTDTAKTYIRLVLDKSLKNNCGIENSPQLFIKFVSDSSSDFTGKTYLVFKK